MTLKRFVRRHDSVLVLLIFCLGVLSGSLIFFGCAKENADAGPRGESHGEPIGVQTLGQITEVTEAKEIVGKHAHICVLLADDRIRCWGRNNEGQCNPKSARNAARKLHDISNARFSKIVTGEVFTCGIIKDEPYQGIPFCFGGEGPFLDVPNEPVLDISANHGGVCFLKADGRLGCVGDREIALAVKLGIDPVTKKAGQDFSNKIFKNLKADVDKVCAQGADDGILYCMGKFARDHSVLPALSVLDYYPGNPHQIFYLKGNGKLKCGDKISRFRPNPIIPDPYKLTYKKFLDSRSRLLLLTDDKNYYSGGSPMPENTFISVIGTVEEGVLSAVSVESSWAIDRYEIECFLKNNGKVKCISHNAKGDTSSPIITDIPKEIAY